MIIFGQSCSIRAKVVVIRQKWFLSGKNCCIGVKWLYSVKSGCIRAKVAEFGKIGFIWKKKWLYSVKVIVFVQIRF